MAEIDAWKTSSDEEEADDLFSEEGDDDQVKGKKEKAQEEMKEAGMLLVSGSEWKDKLKETLIQASKDKAPKSPDFSNAVKEVERAGKATCLVRRKTNGNSRLERLENMKDKEALKKAKNGKGGTGTGFLMFPKHGKCGWLVITNNHVIMDEDEAESAEVIFDHLDDDSLNQTKKFKVKKLVSKDIPTKNAKDLTSLDFSVLALESGDKDEDYLKNCAMPFEETARVNACTNETMLNLCGLQFTPIIAFSHGHGLGKRFSIGKFPDKCEDYPTAHIKHSLPTARGSSGANLIVALPNIKPLFVDWGAAFVHYRHGCAVAWQVIGPVVRKDFSSHE